MRVKIKDQSGEFTLVTIVAEEIETDNLLRPRKIQAMVYCYDKAKVPHVFPAKDIERYD